ncbi:DUF2269 family protein [Nitrosospira sp. NRS527]|uniref:DUF2269 family protein n=1 Tax=Nitrosospira sp. NRS527 TaxID=155925 RepID=UPI0032AF03CD
MAKIAQYDNAHPACLSLGTTVIIQPVTGSYLVYLADIPLTSRWILWSIGLYLLAGSR